MLFLNIRAEIRDQPDNTWHRSLGDLPPLALAAFMATLAACSGGGGPSTPFEDLDTDVRECALEDMFVPGGTARANIVALVDPPLVEGLAPAAGYLSDSDRVIGLEFDDQFVAVPHNILWRHEIVNLDLSGIPVAVTYSPLSGSSMVFDRRSVGSQAIGVANQVVYNNLVMFSQGADGQAGSTWAQMERGAGCGPFNGQSLPLFPAIEMTWDGWLALHPETRVVSSETGFSHDYVTYPYGDYEQSHNPLTYFPHEAFDERRAPKDRVLGVPYAGGGGMAFPLPVLQGRGSRSVFQWVAGDEPTVVFWDVDLYAAVAYEATVNGQLLNFFRINRFENGRFFDEETGSEWSFEGLAIDGPLKGTRLKQVVEANLFFWFAWSTFVPETFLMETFADANDALNAGKNSPVGEDLPDDIIRPENPAGDIWERSGDLTRRFAPPGRR